MDHSACKLSVGEAERMTLRVNSLLCVRGAASIMFRLLGRSVEHA